MVNSRRKGKEAELEAAKALESQLGLKARRGQQFHGGSDSPDVVTDLAGVHFEVKRTECFSLYPAMGQAVNDAAGKVPVVLHRKSRQPWVAIIPLDRLAEFCWLFAELKEPSA